MADKTEGTRVYNIVLFAFDGQATADRIVKQVKSSAKLEGYTIIAEAVVEQDQKGKLHIHEPGRGGVGTAVGLATGSLLGLIGGPAGLLVWAIGGGVLGGVAGKYLGRPIPKEDLERIGDALRPNSSAFLLLLEDTQTEGVIDSMKDYRADVITLTVGDQLSGEIATYVAAQATDAAGNPVALDAGTAPGAGGGAKPGDAAGGEQPAAGGDAGSAP
jgi:uncharacterized membrane protein